MKNYKQPMGRYDEMLENYQKFHDSKEFHEQTPRTALELHILHLEETGTNRSKIASIIQTTRSNLCKLMAERKYPVSCKFIVKLCVLTNLAPDVAEAWLRGFGYELDCRIPTYQAYRLLLREFNKSNDKSFADIGKFNEMVDKLLASRAAKDHENEQVRALCKSAIAHAKKHDLKELIKKYASKEDSSMDIAELSSARWRNSEIIIRLKTLERIAEELNLSDAEKKEVYRVAGRHFSAG